MCCRRDRCKEVRATKKMCSICRQTKPEKEFRLMKRKKGDSRFYRNSYCRDCEKWYMRMYMRQRREKSAHNEAATSGALR